MHIDFDLLRRERTIDPFAFAPIDIAESVGFTAEVLRDNFRANPDAADEAGVGSCRVKVASPTPRLRQRLAILGWMPVDPASDEVWYLDEPIELRDGDNHLVASFVAQYYAEGMNLLFAPDEGMFSGGAYHVAPGLEASDGQLNAHLRLLADRAYVALAVVTPKVPGDWFASAVRRAVERDNAARSRAGLPAITVPSRSTLGRWLKEIHDRLRNRACIGAEWRSYEGPDVRARAPSPEQGASGSRRTTSRAVERSAAKVALASNGSAKTGSLTRAQRSRSIVVQIQAAAAQDGRWEPTDLGGGRTARLWVVDLAEGLYAYLTTRFSGKSDARDVPDYGSGLDMQQIAPPPEDDLVIDLYVQRVGKVLSVGTRDGVDRVISMMPGPWEATFGLPPRSWSPAVQRRLQRRT